MGVCGASVQWMPGKRDSQWNIQIKDKDETVSMDDLRTVKFGDLDTMTGEESKTHGAIFGFALAQLNYSAPGDSAPNNLCEFWRWLRDRRDNDKAFFRSPLMKTWHRNNKSKHSSGGKVRPALEP